MKSIITILVLGLVAMALFTGCAGYATMNQAPAYGAIYTDVKAPMHAIAADMNGTSASKVGTATCSSILGWIAMGDASIDAAMKAGGITKLHHVDFHATQILGLYATYTVTAYGE
jgi:hypothetical protein